VRQADRQLTFQPPAHPERVEGSWWLGVVPASIDTLRTSGGGAGPSLAIPAKAALACGKPSTMRNDMPDQAWDHRLEGAS